MDNSVGSFSKTSLIFLTFLHQTNSQDPVFQAELDCLCDELNIRTVSTIECDGELEVDGHSPSAPSSFLQDILPQAQLELPGKNSCSVGR